MNKSFIFAGLLGATFMALTLLVAFNVGFSGDNNTQVAQVIGAGVPTEIIAQTKLLQQGAGLYDRAGNAERADLARSMEGLAKARRDTLLANVIDNPTYVLENAIPEGIRSQLPPQARPYIEETTSLTGEVSVVHLDYFPEDGEPSGVFRYNLTTPKGKVIALSFANNPPGFISGAQIHARGVLIEGPVADEVTDMDGAMALYDGTDAVLMYAGGGEESAESAGPVTEILPDTFGEQKTLVLLGLSSDVSVPPRSREFFIDRMFGTSSAYFMEASYNQTWLAGDVVDWVAVPWTSAECPLFQSEMHTYLVAQAEANGVDTSQYPRHVIFTNDMDCWFAGIATVGGDPSVSWNVGYFDKDVAEHEYGHNLGLRHAHNRSCDDDTTFGGVCESREYGDVFDTMGSGLSFMQYNPLFKERLGWLDYGSSPLIQDVTTDGTYIIKAYETDVQDVKALRIERVGVAPDGDQEYFYFNYYRPIGMHFAIDEALYDNTPQYCRGSSFDKVFGRIAYQHPQYDSTNLVRTESDLIHLDPFDCWYDFFSGRSDWRDPGLPVGKTMIDPYSGVSVTLNAISDTDAEVSVAFGAGSCIENGVITENFPSLRASAPGGTAGYSVYITNLDAPACSNRTLRVVPVLPAGWSANPNPYEVNLTGLDTNNYAQTITSHPSASDGDYLVTLNVVDVTNPSAILDSITLTYTVDTTLPPAVDTTPPTTNITAPVQGDLVGKGTIINISADSTDNVGVDRVEIYVAGSRVCTDTTAPYSCSWKVPKGKSRTYGIHSEAYDDAGNVGYSSTVYVTSGSSDGGGSGSGGGGGDKCTPGAQKKGEC